MNVTSQRSPESLIFRYHALLGPTKFKHPSLVYDTYGRERSTTLYASGITRKAAEARVRRIYCRRLRQDEQCQAKDDKIWATRKITRFNPDKECGQ